MSGPGDNSLARRTGAAAARSINLTPAMVEGTKWWPSSTPVVIYAKVHFGPRGSEVKIVPIKAKMLAIPLAAGKTGAGVARGGPTSGIWGPTKCFRSKAGNLIIWGYQTGKAAMGPGRRTVTGGHANAVSIPYARRAMNQGELGPLFVLRIPWSSSADRPHDDLIQWAKPVLTEEN